MQHSSDSKEIAEPEDNGQSSTTDSPAVDEPTLSSDLDSMAASTVLAEVLPEVTVVFDAVPAELKLDPPDFGLVPVADRQQISTALASIGSAATAAGNFDKRSPACNGSAGSATRSRALLQIRDDLQRLPADERALELPDHHRIEPPIRRIAAGPDSPRRLARVTTRRPATRRRA